MSEDVRVLKPTERSYAAEVHEGGNITEHKVTFGQEMFDAACKGPEPAGADRRCLVRTGNASLSRGGG